MPGIFASYPIEGGGGGSTVSSLNGLTGALTLVAGAGITITPSGSNITIAASGSSGANQALSNLTSPTAINQALIFGSGTAGNIQTFTVGAGNAQSLTLTPGTGNSHAGTLNLNGGAGSASAGSISGPVNLTGGASQNTHPGAPVTVKGGPNSGTSGNGGQLILSGGDSVNGNGGGALLASGTGTGGSRGALVISDGSEVAGAPGWVLTLVDNGGTATWMPNSGGGANQSLSNLNSPTAINAAAFTFSVDPTITSPSVLTFLTSAMAIQGLESLPATLELYDDTGNFFVGFKSSTGLSSSTTWTLPPIDGTNGQVLSTDGTANLFWGSVANGALSNLTAPTSINTSLIPDSDNHFNLGQPGAIWGTVYASALNTNGNNLSINATGVAYNWPTADATSANQALVSDAAGTLSFFAGASGTFTTVDLKTVTVVNGLITSIV